MILSPLQLHTNMWEVEVIKQRILAYRQILIQQDFNRTGKISEQLVQAFDVQLIKVEEDDDEFYISEPLPKPIIIRTTVPFINVHNTLKGRNKKPLGYISAAAVPYTGYRKFTKKADFYTYENDRIIGYTNTESVRVRAIWDNPLEVYKFAQQESFKLSCSTDSIYSPCSNGIDIYLEETLAARILTFFNPQNAKVDNRDNSGEGDRV